MVAEVSHPRSVHFLLMVTVGNISFDSYMGIKHTDINLQSNKEINHALYHKTMSHPQLRKHY